jgi:hypothetical protein
VVVTTTMITTTTTGSSRSDYFPIRNGGGGGGVGGITDLAWRRRHLQDGDNTTATDEDDFLSVSLYFSLWYPGYHGVLHSPEEEGDDSLTRHILSVLRNLLCRQQQQQEEEEGSSSSSSFEIVSSEGTSSLCPHDDNDDVVEPVEWTAEIYSSRQPPILAIGETTTLALGSISVQDSGRIRLSSSSSADLEWMEWNVTYVVIELARRYWTLDPTGTLAGYPKRHDDQLQSDLQTILNDAIEDGTLSVELQERVDSSLPRWSVNGNEVQTLEEAYESLMKQYDFMDGARVLRFVGIGLGAFTLMMVVVLSIMAGRRRRLRQHEGPTCELMTMPSVPLHEPADLALPPRTDPMILRKQRTAAATSRSSKEGASLDTEESVNHMLMLGRQQVLVGDAAS